MAILLSTGLRQLLTGDKLNMAVATDLMTNLALQIGRDLASTIKGGFAGTNASSVKVNLSTNVGDTAMLTHKNIPEIIT